VPRFAYQEFKTLSPNYLSPAGRLIRRVKEAYTSLFLQQKNTRDNNWNSTGTNNHNRSARGGNEQHQRSRNGETYPRSSGNCHREREDHAGNRNQ